MGNGKTQEWGEWEGEAVQLCHFFFYAMCFTFITDEEWKWHIFYFSRASIVVNKVGLQKFDYFICNNSDFLLLWRV